MGLMFAANMADAQETPQLLVKTNNTYYQLENARRVSRSVKFHPVTKNSNAYGLADVKNTLTYAAKESGCCNVNVLEYCPHKITHMETAAHIMAREASPPTALDIPVQHLEGVLYLADFSGMEPKSGALITEDQMHQKLQKIDRPISMLALKTPASNLNEHYDFSGKDFMALSEQAARMIHDFGKNKHAIQCLVLDLPSIDPEHDNGNLLAHRAYFGLPAKGFTGIIKEKRALVELAWLQGMDEGYYYAVVTPAKFQANAVHTEVTLWKMKPAGQ